MKAKGCDVSLYGNKPGFTLPSNIGELGDDITKLDLQQCSLQGSCSCRHQFDTKRKKPIAELSSRFPFAPRRDPA